MGDGQTPGLVGLDKGEGRARHFEPRIVGHGADQRAGEGRLPGPEAARQRHDVAGREAGGDVLGERDGRRLVGEVDGQRGGKFGKRHWILSPVNAIVERGRRWGPTLADSRRSGGGGRSSDQHQRKA